MLETGFVHVDVGTPQEIYLWPYFARIPLKALTPQQRVELFRIVTGADYKDMVEFGVYSFYRLGIAPDGTWQFFVAGELGPDPRKRILVHDGLNPWRIQSRDMQTQRSAYRCACRPKMRCRIASMSAG